MYAKICRFGEISGYQKRTKFLLYIKIKKRHFREIFGIQELQFIVHDLCRKKMSLCGDLEIFGEGNCGTYSKTCCVGKIFVQQRLQFVVQIQNKTNVILGRFWSHMFLTMKFVLGICCTYTKICRFGEISGVQNRPKFLL